MRPGPQDGYILASALGVVLAISIVAAALVSASQEALARVRRLERETAANAALESAITLAGSQLAIDPRRRQLDFENDPTIAVLEHSVRIEVRWESRKLDLNRAKPEDVDALVRKTRLSAAVRSKVVEAVRSAQARGEPISLVDGFGLDQDDADCLTSILTAFGGEQEYDPQRDDTVLIGGPAAGSRLAIQASLEGPQSAGLSAVVLMTGDPAAPARILDWRRTGGGRVGETCDGA